MTIPHFQKAVVLARRPKGNPVAEDFAVVDFPVRRAQESEVLIRNQYLSMDAGFRKWMNAGSSDEHLPEMPPGGPVHP